MSLLDLHADDLVQAGVDSAGRAAPNAPASKFSAWSAVPRGMASAFVEGAAALRQLDEQGRAGMSVRSQAVKDDQEAYRARYGNRQFSDVLRSGVDAMRPDPATASIAESLLFDAARVITKAGTYTAAGGLLGGGALTAGDETLAAADVLRKRGVSPDVALKAGAVQGVMTGVGAVLPMAGSTLAKTAALYLAGGPAGFMAQQAMTREVLAGYGYDKVAASYDPFDPVGLAVASIVPLPFAYAGLRSARAAKAAEVERGPVPSDVSPVAAAAREVVSPDTVDAALVHNLTLARLGADAKAAGLMEPTTRTIPSLAEFVAAGKFKPTPTERPVQGNFLGWIKANGGLAIGEKLDITGDANNVRNNPGGIFRSGGVPSDELTLRASVEGYLTPDQAGDTRAFVDLVQTAMRGERVLTFQEQMADAARAAREAEITARMEELQDRLRLLGVDPKEAGGSVEAMDAYVQAHEPQLLAAALDELAAARSADSDVMPEAGDIRSRARQVAEDIRESGRTIEQWESEVGPLSPVMRARVADELKASTDAPSPAQAADTQGAAPARVAGGEPAAAATEVAADAGRPAAGVEAAGVDAKVAAARVQAIAQEFPDLQVMLDGMDAPMRLADFLDAAKAEADEMMADAPLYQVAAQCALMHGA